jgi:rhodanese-related sulfurtransferase
LNEEDVITASDLKYLIDHGRQVKLIDVRELNEYEICHIDGSKLIPLGELPKRILELNIDDEHVIYCHTGERSAWAVTYLKKCGLKNVKNLIGGIDAWAVEVDPSIARY